jgi:hypothetical protein
LAQQGLEFQAEMIYTLSLEEIMQAVEFETFVENGMIPIPVEYRDSVAKNVKVIVLNKEPVKTKHHNPPVNLRDARAHLAFMRGRMDDSSRKYAGCLRGKAVFKGDPVEIQRKMRDEW